MFQSVHYTNIQINKRCYQKLATQFHGKTVSWFLKTKTSRLRFLPSLFWNLWKVRKCVNLLCIKCQRLKKRFSIKLSMCFYIVTSWNRISQVFQIKKKQKPKTMTVTFFHNLFPRVKRKCIWKILSDSLSLPKSFSFKKLQKCLALSSPLLGRENDLPY